MRHPVTPLRRAAFLVPFVAMLLVIFGAYFFHQTLTQMSGPPWSRISIDANHILIEPAVDSSYLNVATELTDSAGVTMPGIGLRTARLSQRIVWGCSLAVYAGVSAGVIAAAACIIYLSLTGFHQGERIAAMLLIPAANMLIVAPILSTTLPSSVMLPILQMTVGIDSPDITDIFRSIDALTLATAINLTASCSAILIYPKGDASINAQYMTRMMKLMRTILYAGTSALIVAVMEKSALAHWAITYLPTATEQQAFSHLTASLTMARGVYYSLALLAIYLPTTLILRDQAEKVLQRPPEPDEDPSYREWLRSSGLAITFSDLLPKGVAILGPFLAGPIVEAIKGIWG